MSKSANNSKGLIGPFGLRISASQFSATTYKPGTTKTVTPAYASKGVKLGDVKKRADNVSLYLGGLLSSVSGTELPLATSTEAWAFDTVPIDNGIDSFYLSDLTFTAPPSITLQGLVTADNVKIVAKDLSNHPDLLKAKGLAAGQWLGSITLSGSKLSFPAIAGLSVTPKPSGTDAFSGNYDLATGDVTVVLSQLAYTSPQLGLSLSDSSLKLSNNSKDWSIKGQGELSLPGLGLEKLSGSLDLKAVNAALQSLKASIASSSPIGPLGLSGTLSLEHNIQTKSGSITLQGAQVLGVAADGALSYTDQSVNGTLTLRNQGDTPGSINLGGGMAGLSLTPLQGTANLNYTWAGATPGGTLSFDDLAFVVGLGGKSASFKGDVTLSLTPNAGPTLAAANLQLTSDVSVNLGGFDITLVANDPLAPTKLSLVNSNGSLIPSLSGKIAFDDLAGLSLAVADGGLSYGPNGWTFSNGSLTLGRSVDLGPVRLGANASAQYKDGTLTVNPDLSVNLDVFNHALKPVGQLVTDVLTPITTPIVKAFQTDIDLGSNATIAQGFSTIKDIAKVDLMAGWLALVDYLEAVPGNPYKDRKLTAGELLDFVTYRAYDIVQKNPQTANAAFREVFKTDLPTWLLELPQGIDYASISLSATVARLEAINQLAAALVKAGSSSEQWVAVPFVVDLATNAPAPALSGGEAARQALQAQLRQLSGDLQRLDQLNPTAPPQLTKDIKALPLKFDVGFAVPLFEDPLDNLVKLIASKPIDVLRTDVAVSSGVELGMGIPMSALTSAIPAAAAVFEALNATLELKAGLGAQLALSLGVTASEASLKRVASAVAANPASTPTELLKLFASNDPVTGQALGLFVGQTPNTPMLQLKPYVQAGLRMGLWGVDALGYGRVDGTIDINLTSSDGSNRAYLNDVLSGLATLPGIKGTASMKGTLGLNIDTVFKDFKPSVSFPIVDNATLFNVAPRSNALMALSHEPELAQVADLPLLQPTIVPTVV